ncbi:hypothetical protein [Sphingobacterium sp. LRF_L2]|uniref:hypothetical protein n=1 Tax=Sphingobacterium sp. LRF_L2 TaxID=3369421 RepID=UPI003F635C01
MKTKQHLSVSFSILLIFIVVSSCTKKFSDVNRVLNTKALDTIDLTQYDVYTKHEYFNFNTFSRTDQRDLTNRLNERLGINYLLVKKSDTFPKDVVLISPIKYYSRYKKNVFRSRRCGFSAFSRSYFENQNLIDVRFFNLFRRGHYTSEGKVKFAPRSYWTTSANLQDDEIKVDSVTLSNHDVVAVIDFLQFDQIYKKLDAPFWIFSKLGDGSVNLQPIKPIMLVRKHKKADDIYFEKDSIYIGSRYIKFRNRGK